MTPAYRDLLQTLVRIPSPIGEEAAAQREVERAMRNIGLVTDVFDIDRKALAGVPGFTAPARDYGNRPCVVGTLKGDGGGRSIALNAHIDTAPVDAFGRWTHPPFSGHIEGERLYGRGSWDDKAGVVEILLIVEAFKQAGVKLRGDLVAQIVVEDEATGNGTLACLARGHHTDAAIIVDGTWPERFIVSHMGQLWFRVELEGRSAPASVASRGANPIAAIGPVMRTLQRFVDARNAATAAWGTNTSPVFINIGRTIGGAWEGAVPSGCALDGQFGFVLPDTPDTARAALTEAVESASRRSRVAGRRARLGRVRRPRDTGGGWRSCEYDRSNVVRHREPPSQQIDSGKRDLRSLRPASLRVQPVARANSRLPVRSWRRQERALGRRIFRSHAPPAGRAQSGQCGAGVVRLTLHAVLEELQVPRSGVLYVQSSTDWLQKAGFSATDTLAALIEWTRGGTLVMPAYPFRVTHAEYLASRPRFDVNKTPAAIGLIPEVFRRTAGVRRSLDPDFSIAALGADAADIVETSSRRRGSVQ